MRRFGEKAAPYLRALNDVLSEEVETMANTYKGPCMHPVAGPIPAGWTAYTDLVRHPVDGQLGALALCHLTGAYCLVMAGVFRTLPQNWAQEQAARLEAPDA